MAAASGVQKQLDRIQRTLDSGAFYEAQQMYKTAYHRNKAKKLLPESHQILLEGALQQMHAKQVTCGSELALMLVDAFVEESMPADPDNVQQLETLLESFPAPSTSTTTTTTTSAASADPSSDPTRASTLELDELERVAGAALNWLRKQGDIGAARQLHDTTGRHIWKLYGWPALGRASHHLVRGKDAEGFAGILKEVAALLPVAYEVDFLVLRAVLQTLAAASPTNASVQEGQAHALFEACRKAGLVSSHPASNFCKFLLMALDAEKEELFRLVMQQYRPVWSKDASLGAYLAKVQRVYFGRGAGGGGGLGGLLQELMGSLGHEEED